MFKADFLKNLSEELLKAFPSHLDSFKKDFENNCQLILNKAFTQFNLITREEFDTQVKVLARTRQKCEALEEKLKALEAAKNKDYP